MIKDFSIETRLSQLSAVQLEWVYNGWDIEKVREDGSVIFSDPEVAGTLAEDLVVVHSDGRVENDQHVIDIWPVDTLIETRIPLSK